MNIINLGRKTDENELIVSKDKDLEELHYFPCIEK